MFPLLEGTIIKKKLLSYNLMMIIIIITCIIVHISVMINLKLENTHLQISAPIWRHIVEKLRHFIELGHQD